MTYGLENLPVSEMSGMYTLSFTTDEDGVIASRQFVAESLTDASVSVKVKGQGQQDRKGLHHQRPERQDRSSRHVYV